MSEEVSEDDDEDIFVRDESYVVVLGVIVPEAVVSAGRVSTPSEVKETTVASVA